MPPWSHLRCYLNYAAWRRIRYRERGLDASKSFDKSCRVSMCVTKAVVISFSADKGRMRIFGFAAIISVNQRHLDLLTEFVRAATYSFAAHGAAAVFVTVARLSSKTSNALTKHSSIMPPEQKKVLRTTARQGDAWNEAGGSCLGPDLASTATRHIKASTASRVTDFITDFSQLSLRVRRSKSTKASSHL